MEERRSIVVVDDVAELMRPSVVEDVRVRCERFVGSLVGLGRQTGISVVAAYGTRGEQS